MVLLAGLALAALSCGRKEEAPGPPGGKGQLVILHPPSLTAPLQALTAQFKKTHPGVDVQTEVAGSLDLARKVLGGQRADLFISSDYTVIANDLVPKSASWFMKFARDYMTIAFTDKSKLSERLNQFNWHDHLAKPGVRGGYADPNSSPMGYRALLAMQLGGEYYMKKELGGQLKKNIPENAVKPSAVELLKMLQAGELDFVWIYRSLTKQNNLRNLVLQPEIDLSSGSFEDVYKKAKIEITGASGQKREMVGEPIFYAVTIPTTAAAQDAAMQYLKLMVGAEGQDLLKKNFLMPLSQCEASDKAKVPQELAELCK